MVDWVYSIRLINLWDNPCITKMKLAKRKFKQRQRERRHKFDKLDAGRFALAGGIVAALCAFFVTLLQVLLTGFSSHFTWILTEMYGFIGYRISVIGAFLGAFYSFLHGYAVLWLFAQIYDRI